MLLAWMVLLCFLCIAINHTHAILFELRAETGESSHYYCDAGLVNSTSCEITLTSDMWTDDVSFHSNDDPTTVKCKSCNIGNLNVSLFFDNDYIGNALDAVDLSQSNITHLKSRSIIGLIRSINLSFNEIRNIPEFVVQSSALKVMDLSFNKIKEIDAGAFVLTRRLETLILRQNNIAQLQKQFFDNVISLTELDLSFNKIESIDANTFQLLHALKVLNLKENALKTIEPDMFASQLKLESLDISNNDITQLPGNILAPLTNLVRVNYDGNQLSQLQMGPHLIRLRKLKYVNNLRFPIRMN